MSGPGPVVVVGAGLAGLAGLRASPTLRERGFTGDLTVLGDEPHSPYDRPSLSKEVLTGRRTTVETDLPVPADLDARWLLGRRAVALDRVGRRLLLDDGTALGYGGLVIATGAAARPWPGPGAPPGSGVHTLRGRRDALDLHRALLAGGPLLVIGAGFLGRDALEGALLSDGSRVAARTALLALGAHPNTGWLRGSGLRRADGTSGGTFGGVACDHRGRALEADGRPAPDIVVLGDAAARPHPLPGGGSPAHLDIGHWSEAVDQADAVAAALLGQREPARDTVPSFWPDQFGLRIRSVGLPQLADRVEVHDHDPARSRLEVSYHRGQRTVGALTANPTSLAAHRERIRQEWQQQTTPV